MDLGSTFFNYHFSDCAYSPKYPIIRSKTFGQRFLYLFCIGGDYSNIHYHHLFSGNKIAGGFYLELFMAYYYNLPIFILHSETAKKPTWSPSFSWVWDTFIFAFQSFETWHKRQEYLRYGNALLLVNRNPGWNITMDTSAEVLGFSGCRSKRSLWRIISICDMESNKAKIHINKIQRKISQVLFLYIRCLPDYSGLMHLKYSTTCDQLYKIIPLVIIP